MKDRILIIAGPTSVGKSEIAIDVAKVLDGEIVSADSMQVYRGMDIGTGKLSEDEMGGVRHHMIDVIDPAEDFNVSRFREMAVGAIDDIISRGKLPIIVGGTGFYIKALLHTDDTGDPGKDPDYKNSLRERAEREGLDSLREELMEADSEYLGRITANDRMRIIRALEYHHATGRRYSDHCDSSVNEEPLYDASFFVLECDRSVLYRKMDERVDRMVENGLVEEVRRLLNKGVGRSCTSMNGIGYKEVAKYLSGEMTLDEAVRLIKSNTHHYAVRQSTWFRNQDGAEVIDCSDREQAAKAILDSFRKR